MLLFPDSRGILPFYDELPTWDCAPMCSGGESPSFLIKGGASVIFKKKSDNSFLQSHGAEQYFTITEGSKSCDYTYFPSVPLPNGQYYAVMTIGSKRYFSDLIDVSDCKKPYRIKAELKCDNISLGPSGIIVDIGLEGAAVTLVDPETISQENINDGFGQSVDEFYKQRDLYTIDTWMTPGLKQTLSKVKMFDSVTLCCPDGQEFELDARSLLPSYSQDLNKFSTGTIVFAYKDSWICKSSCDCFDIPEVFEDDCDLDPDDPACAECEAELVVDGNNLILDITNPPAGTPVITWTLNGSYLSSANSINTQGIKGLYQVTLKFPNCPEKTFSHQVLDPCENFSVQLECNGLKIDGVINGIPEDDTETISICDSDGVEVGASFPTVVPDEGVYTIKVETQPSGCTFITNKEVGDPLCEWQFHIEKDANGLLSPVFDIPCDDTPTYIWSQIVNANDATQVGFNADYQPTESGLYVLQITCGGCVKEEQYVCIIVPNKTQIEICNWEEMPPITIDGSDINVNTTVDLSVLTDWLSDPANCVNVKIKDILKVCIDDKIDNPVEKDISEL